MTSRVSLQEVQERQLRVRRLQAICNELRVDYVARAPLPGDQVDDLPAASIPAPRHPAGE